MQTIGNEYWWERDDLRYIDNQLYLGATNLNKLTASHGTPLYVYNASRAKQNLQRLHCALESKSINHRLFYAMKSNRYAPLLTYLKLTGLCGIDACSPGELLLALECGFKEEDISYTATAMSDGDCDILAKHPGIVLNLDSLTAIRKIGERCPGRNIGLRINPALGVGYETNELLRYSGSKTTKFGIYKADFDEAVRLSKKYGLNITGIHLHTGCGYLTPQLPVWRSILEESRWFVDKLPRLEYLNVGGGLGIPLAQTDNGLDLNTWNNVIVETLSGAAHDIWVEPGDYIVKDTGVLLLQVTMVERKQNTLFIGVNGGFNIHIEPAFYHLPLHPVPVKVYSDHPADVVTIAGNINEALDIFYDNIIMPLPEEGDYLAFLNAGGYGASMSSNHCMRGIFKEMLILQ